MFLTNEMKIVPEERIGRMLRLIVGLIQANLIIFWLSGMCPVPALLANLDYR